MSSLVPSGPNSVTPYSSGSSNSSILDQAIKNSQDKLEYLRGHEADIGKIFKFFLYGGSALWLYLHSAQVLDFVSNIVDIEFKLLYGGILAFAIWITWVVLSSKKFQYTIAMMIDRTIDRFHRWMVARDPEGSARFSIGRLRKHLAWGNESKAKVGAALEQVSNAAEADRLAAMRALGQVQDFMKEKAARSQGRGNPRVRLTDSQLDNSIALAKGELRRRYQAWQEEAANAKTLGAKYALITDVLDSSQVELVNLEQDFEAAKKRYQLNLVQMQALDAAREVIQSRERETLNGAMSVLQQQADYCAGRTRVIMEQLDPTVQAYHATQASNVMADDSFYQAIANDPGLQIKPETQQKVLDAPSKPMDDAIENLLGGGTAQAERVPVNRVDASAPQGRSKLNDLLK